MAFADYLHEALLAPLGMVVTSADLTRDYLTQRTRNDPKVSLGLADRERVTAPSMNRTVSQLEEVGYLTRIPDEVDRRRVTIDLTDLGRRIVDETVRRRDAFVEEALAELSPEERQVLARATTIMRKVADR